MLEFDINWLAWLVVVAFSMVLGFIWYAKGVFGNAWMALIGKSEEDLKTGRGSAMFGMVIMSALMFFLLANFVQWSGVTTVGDGLLVGLYLWLGLVFAPIMMGALFEGKSMKLIWINIGNLLVGILVGSAIFATWT